MKQFIRSISTVLLTLAGCILVNYLLVSLLANWLDTDAASLTSPRVGLVFGTSKSTVQGVANIFFSHRIRKAVELYQQGFIQYILVSGDNRAKEYNETQDMSRALIEAGIPAQDIVLDYAGLNTRDSVARAQTIFGLDQVVLISQSFQTQRALIACLKFQITCHSSPSDKIPFALAPKIYARELGSRVKLWRRFVFDSKPLIAGKQESTPWDGN